MPNRDPHLHTLLSGLKTPPLSDSFVMRLKGIADQPQAQGLLARLGVIEDLSFGLRHDVRYQLAAALAALVLSLGVWQGYSLTNPQSHKIINQPDEMASLMEVDPVLAGGL